MKRIKNQYQYYQQKINGLKMNPHFIFNALNSAQYYIQTEQTEQASEYVDEFTKLMRMKLEQGEEDLIPLSSEIELLAAYTKIESMRKNGRISFEIQCDPELTTVKTFIPPMLVQPLVENAILHGFKDLNDGKVIIEFKKVDQNLKINVLDNGIGWLKNGNASMELNKNIHALDIFKKRLYFYSKLYDQDFNHAFSTAFESDQRPGVKCSISIPWITQPIKTIYEDR